MNKLLYLWFESNERLFINECSDVVIATPVSFDLNINKFLEPFLLSDTWSDVVDVGLIAIPTCYFLGI